MSHEITLDIPAAWWMSSNQRLHWARRAERTGWVRQMFMIAARNAALPRMEQVHVAAEIGYPRAVKADPANAAPTVKAALDGLTDAGVWPDDDSEHVVAVTYLRSPKTGQAGLHRVRLILTDQTVPWGGDAA